MPAAVLVLTQVYLLKTAVQQNLSVSQSYFLTGLLTRESFHVILKVGKFSEGWEGRSQQRLISSRPWRF